MEMFNSGLRKEVNTQGSVQESLLVRLVELGVITQEDVRAFYKND